MEMVGMKMEVQQRIRYSSHRETLFFEGNVEKQKLN